MKIDKSTKQLDNAFIKQYAPNHVLASKEGSSKKYESQKGVYLKPSKKLISSSTP